MKEPTPQSVFNSLLEATALFSERESNSRYPGPGGLVSRSCPEGSERRKALQKLTSDMVASETAWLGYAGIFNDHWKKGKPLRGRANNPIAVRCVLCGRKLRADTGLHPRCRGGCDKKGSYGVDLREIRC